MDTLEGRRDEWKTERKSGERHAMVGGDEWCGSKAFEQTERTNIWEGDACQGALKMNRGGMGVTRDVTVRGACGKCQFL